MRITKLLSAIILLSAVLMSCTKNYNYNIENVTVQFEAKELISKVEKAFTKQASLNPANSSTFVHVIPSNYKAHFVASEARGQYAKDQLIKTITVQEGSQTITIPKLKYRVVVTSYDFDEAQLTWSNLDTHLPKSDDTIHLYGENNIDYINNTSGTVEVKNPYAAIMIANNEWVNGVPIYDTDSKEFSLVDNSNWYLLYIRPENGQTHVRVPVPLDQAYYTIKNKFNANTIYEYTFNGVGDTDGNFTVDVEEIFKVVERETIDLY